MLRLLQSQMPEPELSFGSRETQLIFTDGSCLHPDSPEARWASYAIVATDLQVDALPPDTPVEQFPMLQQQHFYVLGMGHVTGAQTIPRAELQAAVVAHETQRGLPLYTDSSYVVGQYHLLCRTLCLADLHKYPNFELLARWHALLWQHHCQTPTFKVAAHKLLDRACEDSLVCRLGNDLADRIAKQAAHSLQPEYIAQLQQRAQDTQQDLQFLQDQYQLRTALVNMRGTLQHTAGSLVSWNPDQVFQEFLALEVVHPQEYFVADDDWQHLAASKYGVPFSELVLKWALSLRWPRDAEQTNPPIGVTWFELAVNFLITTQKAIIFQSASQFVDVDADEHWDRLQCNVNHWANSLRHCLRHLEFVLQRTLIPKSSLQHVAALYKLGGGVYKQGFNRRPAMLCQFQTLTCVRDYLKGNLYSGKTCFNTIPTIPEIPPVFQADLPIPPADTMRDRELRYQNRRRDIARSRG
eukprot:Skav223268  [mRNA]  locus=scaffold3424:27945:29348:+ [translate_table: standard]